MKKIIKRLLFLILVVFFISGNHLWAQVIEEPNVLKIPKNISNIQDLYNSGFGLNVAMNNFGFGIGGEYRKVVAPQSEITASLRITGLRDASEQTFTDIFFGQQIVPNKYQRAFAFPLLLGLRKQFFADAIEESYRFFASASIGPAVAFTYPYFDDINDDGYRFTGDECWIQDQSIRCLGQPEPINDIFTGWGKGDWHWGGAGEFKVGVDIGSNFARLNSVEFGYYFYYFPDAIQIMMPRQPKLRENRRAGESPFEFDEEGNLVMEEFHNPQKFFGSPQITFTFGWLW